MRSLPLDLLLEVTNIVLRRTPNVVEFGSSLHLDRSSNQLNALDGGAVQLVPRLDTKTGDLVSEGKVGSKAISLNADNHATEMSSVGFVNSDNITRQKAGFGALLHELTTPSIGVEAL